jgi:hypothetical protein
MEKLEITVLNFINAMAVSRRILACSCGRGERLLRAETCLKACLVQTSLLICKKSSEIMLKKHIFTLEIMLFYKESTAQSVSVVHYA